MTVDEKIDAILSIVRNIEKRVAAVTVKQAAASSSVPLADDRDLDGQYGNFTIKKDPPRWSGDSFVGCALSECSPEYLDELAGFKMWQAGKEDAKGGEDAQKKAHFLKKDAGRCAGWAARIRGGWKAPEGAPLSTGDDDGGVPF